METRSAKAQTFPDGRIVIQTTSQSPFAVREMISKYFQTPLGNVVVQTPLVGGAFGGKATVQIEVLAVLASRVVGGRPVRIVNTREQDITSSPVGIGLDARIKLGSTKCGKIVAAESTYMVDAGAYTDSAPRVTRAIASDCTGPYSIENVWCDSLCIYTNHTICRCTGYEEIRNAARSLLTTPAA